MHCLHYDINIVNRIFDNRYLQHNKYHYFSGNHRYYNHGSELVVQLR